MGSGYTWDESKRVINLDKHGVDFAAVYDLDWTTVIEGQDNRRDYNEIRMAAFGLIGDRLYCLIYTQRGDSVHVISLRKANKREVKRYEKAQD